MNNVRGDIIHSDNVILATKLEMYHDLYPCTVLKQLKMKSMPDPILYPLLQKHTSCLRYYTFSGHQSQLTWKLKLVRYGVGQLTGNVHLNFVCVQTQFTQCHVCNVQILHSNDERNRRMFAIIIIDAYSRFIRKEWNISTIRILNDTLFDLADGL